MPSITSPNVARGRFGPNALRAFLLITHEATPRDSWPASPGRDRRGKAGVHCTSHALGKGERLRLHPDRTRPLWLAAVRPDPLGATSAHLGAGDVLERPALRWTRARRPPPRCSDARRGPRCRRWRRAWARSAMESGERPGARTRGAATTAAAEPTAAIPTPANPTEAPPTRAGRAAALGESTTGLRPVHPRAVLRPELLPHRGLAPEPLQRAGLRRHRDQHLRRALPGTDRRPAGGPRRRRRCPRCATRPGSTPATSATRPSGAGPSRTNRTTPSPTGTAATAPASIPRSSRASTPTSRRTTPLARST